MTDKENNAANAWLILNDTDVVEQKFVDMFNKLFSNTKSGSQNRDLFATMVMDTPVVRMRISQTIEGELHYRVNDTLKRTLESAEVVIQEGVTTYKPQIAVRFYVPNGSSFVVYPKVSRV